MIVAMMIVIITGIIIAISNNNNEENKTNQVVESKITEISRVKNRNDFFTVVNCVDRYITYLTTQEPDILYNYLDEDYRKNNGISQSNVLNRIETLDDYYKFKAKEMYTAKNSDTIEQYFVYGTLTIEATGDDEEETPFYISVKLDKTNNTFSVIPNQYIQNMKVVE